MEIEPLLTQIDALSAHFGRVQGDLQTIAARGRAEDFRGVMQNTRLVLEAIMRDLVTRELKQTVGKAMLDELITKFRQQANAGIIPTNILAHMGTVQAWGNLSAHDHAGSLTDQGVTVGKQEVIASLNSMVAILTWYAGKLGVPLDGAQKPPPPVPGPSSIGARLVQTTPPPVAPAPPPAKSPLPIIGGAVALLACLAGGYWFTSRGNTTTEAPKGDPFAELDAQYRSRGEPLPPSACRRPDEAGALAKANDEASLAALHGAEAEYLLARRKYEAGQVPGAEVQRAAACSGFAAALSLAGKTEIREGEAAAKRDDHGAAAELFAKAARNFDAAIAAAPTFKNARFNRGLVLLKLNKVPDGVKDLEEVIAADDSFGEAHFFLGVALEAQARGGDAALAKRAKDEFCAALKHGVQLAKTRCEQ